MTVLIRKMELLTNLKCKLKEPILKLMTFKEN